MSFLVRVAVGVVLLTMWVPAQAKTLSEHDMELVIEQVELLRQAMMRGDMKTLVHRMPEDVITMAGGYLPLLRAADAAMKQMAAGGAKIQAYVVSPPTRAYRSDEHEITFVPTRLEMAVESNLVVSVGYLVGIHRIGDDDWRFIDSAGATEAFLRTTYPGLPKRMKLPKRSQTMRPLPPGK